MCAVPSELTKGVELEIAHVLFIDIVGYSKLLIDEQRDYLHTLNEIVRETDSFRAAEAAGKLTRLPTGDEKARLNRRASRPHLIVELRCFYWPLEW
jgi:hypothetical protein